MQLVKTNGTLPPLVRGGGRKNSEEIQEIIEALQSGAVCKVEDITTDSEYNSTQQRIRSAAKKVEGLGVNIRRKKDEDALYFQGFTEVVESNGESDKAKASK